MADYTRYPNAADLELLLKSNKNWPTDSNAQARAQEQAAIVAKAASDSFEHLVGWEPFLSSGSSSTRVFDETDPSGYLDLEGAVQSLSAVVVNGSTLTANTQYWLQPRNATAKGFGYTGIRLLTRYSFMGFYTPGQISVTGVWGRVTAVPGDVWQACLTIAGQYLLTQVENAQNIASISQDGFSKQLDIVGTIQQKDLANIWGKNYPDVVRSYMRVVC